MSIHGPLGCLAKTHMCLSSVEVVVPNAEERQDDWQVLLERRLFEMVVHHMCTGQELLEVVESDVDCDAEADS